MIWLKCIAVIGLIGYIAAMKGCFDYAKEQAKARNTMSVVVSIIILTGMVAAFGFALAALL